MNKLLATLGLLFLLTSPASAHSGSMTNKTLEHGKSYTTSIVSCNTKDDAMKHIRDISQIQAPYTMANIMATIIDNNCVNQPQYFTYVNEEYVCSFSIQNNNYTLLDSEVEGVKQFIVVRGLANNMFEPCLEVKEMEKTIKE